MDNNSFATLSERHRTYLRLVRKQLTSYQIAFETKSSARAVDKQLGQACKIIGVTSRVEAARLFAEFEGGVESFYPQGRTILPSKPSIWSLVLPLPTEARPINVLTRQQVIAWGIFLLILTPIGIAVAAMVIATLSILLGVNGG